MNPGGDSGAPLYLQLASALRQEIVSGTHPVGSLLPTEEGLCERFAVSRHTVREALRLLREDGLVTSRRGAGTRVLAPATGADIHQVMSINDLLAFAADTRLEIASIDTMVPDAESALRAGLEAGTAWLEVRALRRAAEDNAVLCRTDYYINRAYAAVGRLLPRHQGSIFPLIEDLFGVSITEVQQQISATLVDAELAAVLGVAEGTAALEVRRSYVTAEGTIAQVTINTHPADRFQHSMTMRRLKV
jgi:DNA-binding GntR family transcriptional regulator